MVTLMTRIVFSVCVLLFLSACQERVGLAPVSEARIERESTPVMYRVKRYDTLYSIAFRYDQDYRSIAQMNGFSPPYALRVGQVIYLKTPFIPQRKPQYKPPVNYPLKAYHPPVYAQKISRLRWPSQQKRIWIYFSPEKGRKGIDILGRPGDVIYASGGGVVAYAGDGLNGYGNLIIIKHDDKLLTAYAHNARLFVKEGQKIYPGQKIATMGQLDRAHWGLHYEVREWGKPVNPLRYLSR